MENVLALKARDQSGLLHQLHLGAQFLVAENLVALKLDFHDAHALAFIDYKGQTDRGLGNIFSFLFDRGVRMAVLGQKFFDDADGRCGL